MDILAVTEVDGKPVRPITVKVAAGTYLTVFVTSDILYGIDEMDYDPDADPHATMLWPASVAVAMELPDLVSPGDYVLDLGAGTGLATLMAAHLGAHATAYDHDPFALRLIEEAARMQGLTVETIEFDLRSRESLPPADLVIAADLLYDFDLADSIARHVTKQVTSGGRAIIADPGRVASSEFFENLSENWIYGHYYPVEVALPNDGDELTSVEIHIFGE
jgi:predicted nicotinamide N-methyase